MSCSMISSTVRRWSRRSSLTRRGRCRHNSQVEARHEHDVLTAEAPCVIRLPSSHIAHPPAVAVFAAADPRPPARLERVVDECLRQDLPAVHLSAVAIHLAECQHLARRHHHLVAAEVVALRIAHPWRQGEAQRLRERLLRERERALSRRLREDRGKEMGVAGAVDHLRTRRRQERLRQGMTDPVRALDPRTVVPAARRLEPGPHRQKVLDGDGPLPLHP